MNPNPHWSRWIFSSLASHFETRRLLITDLPMYVEGQRRPDDVKTFAQLRIEGPYFKELQRHYWQINVIPYVFINVIQNDEDIYRLDKYLGNYASIFDRCITIYKYGADEAIDDGEKLGLLTLLSDRNERIRVDKFGQVQVATPVAQATIEAHYSMRIAYNGSH